MSFKDRHAGKSIYFLNTGPSLNNYDLTKIENKYSYSIKNIPITHCNTTYWSCFEDPHRIKINPETWLQHNIKIVSHSVYGLCYTEYIRKKKSTYNLINKLPNVFYVIVKPDYDPKTILDNDHVSWGLNHKRKDKDNFPGRRSIFIGVFPILNYMGFKRIYLLGVDFNMEPIKPYADTREKDIDACETNNLLYKTLDARCIRLQKVFKKVGLEVFNCNKNSKLTAFPYKSFEDSLNDPNLYR